MSTQQNDGPRLRRSPLRSLIVVGLCCFLPNHAGAETDPESRVLVEAEVLPSAYGAPPDLSRGRISTLTKSYVLPPFGFELETIYHGDFFRRHPSQHSFTQEIEIGLPGRFDVAIENQLQTSRGEHSLAFAARYALANWNKIPFNPTLSAGYKFGFGRTATNGAVPDSANLGLILSSDFSHMVEWAMNFSVDQEMNRSRSCDWGFVQSIEMPVLLPEEQLEIGLEMQYRHTNQTVSQADDARGLVFGPTISWRPTKNARLDVSPLLGCTSEAPRLQILVVFSWSLGKSESSELERPASASD